MMRDEAIKKVIEPDAGYDYQHAFVDSLVALGMLKLDEPPNTADLIKEASWWVRVGGAVEVSADSVSQAVALIGKMKTALEQTK